MLFIFNELFYIELTLILVLGRSGGGVISTTIYCIFAENSVYEKSPVYIVIAYIVIVMFAS